MERYPDGTTLTMFLLLQSGDCLFSGHVLGVGEACLFINMQSFALGQWEPQTRLIPRVGILSAAKKKLKGAQLLVLRPGKVSYIQLVSLVKELQLVVSWLSTTEF